MEASVFFLLWVLLPSSSWSSLEGQSIIPTPTWWYHKVSKSMLFSLFLKRSNCCPLVSHCCLYSLSGPYVVRVYYFFGLGVIVGVRFNTFSLGLLAVQDEEQSKNTSKSVRCLQSTVVRIHFVSSVNCFNWVFQWCFNSVFQYTGSILIPYYCTEYVLLSSWRKELDAKLASSQYTVLRQVYSYTSWEIPKEKIWYHTWSALEVFVPCFFTSNYPQACSIQSPGAFFLCWNLFSLTHNCKSWYVVRVIFIPWSSFFAF